MIGDLILMTAGIIIVGSFGCLICEKIDRYEAS